MQWHTVLGLVIEKCTLHHAKDDVRNDDIMGVEKRRRNT